MHNCKDIYKKLKKWINYEFMLLTEKLRDARLADIQSGGKAVTRAEEKQLKLKLL